MLNRIQLKNKQGSLINPASEESFSELLGYFESQEISSGKQISISEKENFFYNLAKNGVIKSYKLSSTEVARNTSNSNTVFTAVSGKKFIPLRMEFVCSEDFKGGVSLFSGEDYCQEVEFYSSHLAKNPLIIEPEGSLSLKYNSNSSFCGNIKFKTFIENSLLHNKILNGNTVASSNIITNLNYTSTIMKGMGISGSGIPENTKIIDVLSATSVLISNNATSSQTSVALTMSDSKVYVCGSSVGIEISDY